MTFAMYAAAAALTLLALTLIAVPMLRNRKEAGVGLSLSAILVLFPLSVAGIYVSVSSYPWSDSTVAVSAGANNDTGQPPVAEMITALKERLEAEPDIAGYMLLGRSYITLQRYADAVDAYHEAWELSEGQLPEVSIAYAEALILEDKRTLTTGAVDLLDSVLAVQPDDARALWYGGLSAAARDMDDLAVERWSKLLQADLPDNMRMVVQQQLAKLGAAVPAAKAVSDNFAADSSLAAAGAPRGVVINTTVNIDPALAALAPPNAMLFLFARNADQPGPPIAVKRLRLNALPLQLALSDADVMIPGSTLKDVARLQLVARISATGTAIAASGDLYGEVFPSLAGADSIDISITIDSVVE